MSEPSVVRRGSSVSSPAVSVSSTRSLGPDQVGHQGGQPVVVAEPDLLVGHGVVLVDHRDHAQLEQAGEGLAGVEVLAAVDEVEGGQQHLAGGQAVGARARRSTPASAGAGRRRPPPGGWPGPRAGAGPGPGRSTRRRWPPRSPPPPAGPAARAVGHLAGQLVDGRGVHPAVAVVTEDEPILTTTVPAVAPAGTAVTTACAGEAGWPVNSGWSRYQTKDRSPMWTTSPSWAPARARARSTPMPAQAALDVVGGLVGGHVVEGHGPLGHPAHHPELARLDPLHGEPLGQGPVDDDGRRPPRARTARASATSWVRRPTSAADALPGDGRDDQVGREGARRPSSAPSRPVGVRRSRRRPTMSALDPTTTRGRSSRSGW